MIADDRRLPTIKQRRLSTLHGGDWYAYVEEERLKGRTLQQIADYFTHSDGIPVHWTTLSGWIRRRQQVTTRRDQAA